MSAATVTVSATPGAQLQTISVSAGLSPVELRWLIFGSGRGCCTIQPGEVDTVTWTASLNGPRMVEAVEIDFELSSEMTGHVIERRADGSRWRRSLEEGDWTPGNFPFT